MSDFLLDSIDDSLLSKEIKLRQIETKRVITVIVPKLSFSYSEYGDKLLYTMPGDIEMDTNFVQLPGYNYQLIENEKS